VGSTDSPKVAAEDPLRKAVDAASEDSTPMVRMPPIVCVVNMTFGLFVCS
jgi:hypothetical protein